VGIVRLADEQIIRVNEFALRMLGYEREALLGQNATGILITAGTREEKLNHASADGRLHGVESHWHTRSGETLDRMVSAEPIEIEGQACILAVGVDITERKHTESLRLELATQRELLALKENFIAMMSHEFRTPLALILSAKESLQYYYD